MLALLLSILYFFRKIEDRKAMAKRTGKLYVLQTDGEYTLNQTGKGFFVEKGKVIQLNP